MVFDGVDQIFALGDSDLAENSTMIKDQIGGISWLHESSSEARSRYIQNEAAKRVSLKCKTPRASEVQAEARRSKMSKITAAAEKIRREAKKKEDKAEGKRQEAVKEAAVEYLRMQYGTKQKPPTAALQERLRKACRCHLSMGVGTHKDKCSYGPTNLRAAMRANIANRASIERQLESRTTLTAHQRARALDHLFGPAVLLTSGSASSGRGPGDELRSNTNLPKKGPYV